MPQWYQKEFRAKHDEDRIDLTSIDMVSVVRRPSGRWKAIEAAFRSLIDTVAVYVEVDKIDNPAI